MSKKELLPCPFCGSVGELQERNLGSWIVACALRFGDAENRMCPVNARTRSGKTKAQAIELWNTRTK